MGFYKHVFGLLITWNFKINNEWQLDFLSDFVLNFVYQKTCVALIPDVEAFQNVEQS